MRSLFFGDDDAEQLVLESLGCDHEVQQQHLGGDLRQVVRVAQLRRDVEPEVGVVLDDVLTQTNHIRSTCVYTSTQPPIPSRTKMSSCSFVQAAEHRPSDFPSGQVKAEKLSSKKNSYVHCRVYR